MKEGGGMKESIRNTDNVQHSVTKLIYIHIKGSVLGKHTQDKVQDTNEGTLK